MNREMENWNHDITVAENLIHRTYQAWIKESKNYATSSTRRTELASAVIMAVDAWEIMRNRKPKA